MQFEITFGVAHVLDNIGQREDECIARPNLDLIDFLFEQGVGLAQRFARLAEIAVLDFLL